MSKPTQLVLTYSLISLITLILLELSLRTVLPIRHWFPENMYVADADPTLSYKLNPGFEGAVKTAYFEYNVSVDENGFRRSDSKTENSGPVTAFFGDSFMFGQGVEDFQTVPTYISNKSQTPINVINTGVYGYTTHQEFITYKRLTDTRAIDTVVLQLYNNDIVIQGEKINRGVYNGFLNADMPKTNIQQIKAWLLNNSEVIAHARRLSYHFAEEKSTAPPEYLQPSFPQTHATEINSTKRLIHSWADEAKRNKQKFFVYLVPSIIEISAQYETQRQQWKESKWGFDADVSHRWFFDLCQQRSDIYCIDIKDAFLNNDDLNLYIADDGHTNENGNKIIADAVLNAINKIQ